MKLPALNKKRIVVGDKIEAGKETKPRKKGTGNRAKRKQTGNGKKNINWQPTKQQLQKPQRVHDWSPTLLA